MDHWGEWLTDHRNRPCGTCGRAGGRSRNQRLPDEVREPPRLFFFHLQPRGWRHSHFQQLGGCLGQLGIWIARSVCLRHKWPTARSHNRTPWWTMTMNFWDTSGRSTYTPSSMNGSSSWLTSLSFASHSSETPWVSFSSYLKCILFSRNLCASYTFHNFFFECARGLCFGVKIAWCHNGKKKKVVQIFFWCSLEHQCGCRIWRKMHWSACASKRSSNTPDWKTTDVFEDTDCGNDGSLISHCGVVEKALWAINWWKQLWGTDWRRNSQCCHFCLNFIYSVLYSDVFALTFTIDYISNTCERFHAALWSVRALGMQSHAEEAFIH